MGVELLAKFVDKLTGKKQEKSLDDICFELKIKEKKQKKQIQSIEMQVEEVERIAMKYKREGDITQYKQTAKTWKVMQSQLNMEKKSLEKIVDIKSSIEAKKAMTVLATTTKEILDYQDLEKKLGLNIDAEKLANDFMKIENSTDDFLDTLELCDDDNDMNSMAVRELDAKLDAQIAGERILKDTETSLDI